MFFCYRPDQVYGGTDMKVCRERMTRSGRHIYLMFNRKFFKVTLGIGIFCLVYFATYGQLAAGVCSFLAPFVVAIFSFFPALSNFRMDYVDVGR